MNNKKVIGRIEKVDFPEWNIVGIDAKIDTGAYTSSLHCHDIELNKSKKKVSFYLFDPSHPEFEESKFQTNVNDIRVIRSSNGLAEERIIISTTIKLLDKSCKIELSLADRTEMRYPVLIGRKFLRNKFIVDVSKKYLGNNNI
jgi:hypothetical protein